MSAISATIFWACTLTFAESMKHWVRSVRAGYIRGVALGESGVNNCCWYFFVKATHRPYDSWFLPTKWQETRVASPTNGAQFALRVMDFGSFRRYNAR
jgi:hypothetical protein